MGIEVDYKSCPKYKKNDCYDCSRCLAPDCVNRKSFPIITSKKSWKKPESDVPPPPEQIPHWWHLPSPSDFPFGPVATSCCSTLTEMELKGLHDCG